MTGLCCTDFEHCVFSVSQKCSTKSLWHCSIPVENTCAHFQTGNKSRDCMCLQVLEEKTVLLSTIMISFVEEQIDFVQTQKHAPS